MEIVNSKCSLFFARQEDMSAGPSQRNLGISTLVYSTLGPSLGLLPNETEDKGTGEVSQNHKPPEEASSAIHEDKIITRPPPADQRMMSSSVSTSDTSIASEIQSPETNDTSSNSGGGESVLSRLYSSPISSEGLKSRLGFQNKKGAGSASSAGAVGGVGSGGAGGRVAVNEDPVPSPISKQLQSQISPKNSVGDSITPR